jgi:hypothetical protein
MFENLKESFYVGHNEQSAYGGPVANIPDNG